MRQYCYQVASVVGLICIHIFGYTGEDVARRHATNLGLAMQLTNICRDVREDWEFGRVYLPQDEMRRFGVIEDDLAAGRVTDSFAKLLQFQIDRAREYFVSGRQLLSRTFPNVPAPVPPHWVSSTAACWTGSNEPDTTCLTNASRSAKRRNWR